MTNLYFLIIHPLYGGILTELQSELLLNYYELHGQQSELLLKPVAH